MSLKRESLATSRASSKAGKPLVAHGCVKYRVLEMLFATKYLGYETCAIGFDSSESLAKNYSHFVIGLKMELVDSESSKA